jgi:hypothetical protein
MKQKTVAIVHFNTTELTEAGIRSLRKHGGEDYRVIVFDNSATLTLPDGKVIQARPFTAKLDGVEVIDNTRGQIIDFDKFLAEYPDRDPSVGIYQSSVWGSAKHIVTVQKLWELLPEGFVLMESDILLKKPIDEFFREEYSFVGFVQWHQKGNPFDVPRIMPMLCWMNVPMLTREGARYFDPDRCWGLKADRNDRGNWMDTGACLLDEVLKKRPRLKGLHVDIRLFVEHYGGGSWKQDNLKYQMEWINRNRHLWAASESDRIDVQKKIEQKDVALCAIVRCENKYLREWVAHHLSLGVNRIIICDNSHGDEEQPTAVLGEYIKKGLVKVLDYRNQGGSFNVQDKAYNEVYQKYGGDFAWMGFLDIDEMIDGCDNVATLLADMKEADVVVLSWRMMTDNGLTHYEDRPVMDRFTEPFIGNRFLDGREFVKCFVRGNISGLTFKTQPHCPATPVGLRIVNAKGESVEYSAQLPPLYEVAWVNHYHTKTAEEFLEKMRRGFPNGDQYTADYRKKAIDYFFAINERTEEKEAILGCGKPKTQKRKSNKSKK